ncbi:chemotaxis protein CheD [Aquisalibacillus elongatus]|uniref:Probable chemoreceptor glutamine deamidase CheD n=1 Tax=Aquisalibacillus elongatus TaxID=485577 RepID=A0A3N5C8T5_9BACI|nr:chemotaxis protein CheD [Aquisalibacillus elongatus]RPF55972.1 chemotaxis protein CheD [Aquisalibacillus elongatus]
MEQTLDIVKVGIADLKVARRPQTISTSGLGSCVGLVIYDDITYTAGMVHIMLPESSLARNTEFNPGKFADTGISELIEQLIKQGAKRRVFKAKMAGGSQMFNLSSQNEKMNIGQKNVNAIEERLEQLSIPIIAKDIGGSSGRTIEFDTSTFELKIRTVYKGITYI